MRRNPRFRSLILSVVLALCAGVAAAQVDVGQLGGQVKDETGAGISFAKSRKKFHVEVAVCGRKQFIGQFKNLLDAQRAKSEFLNSFMDAVLDAVEET